MLTSHKKSKINKLIISWYRRNVRPLPWRRTKNPYRILLSEVMLQQTQVSRVKQIYPQFLRQFPSFKELAGARISELIRTWRGMGYNNRVIRLQHTACIVMDQYKGKLPGDEKLLRTLPGIGRYTANAVACFAFGQIVPVVDTNVKRVLSRLFPQFPNTDHHWSLAESLLPRRNAFEWNQGLMELGATLCTTLSPHCNQCPVRRLCPSSSPPLLKRIASRKNKPRKVDIPNRIYRGRIIETLRNLRDGQSIEAAKVGKKIKNDYSHRDQKWLMELILKLQRDGLLLVHRNGSRAFISLPA